MSDETVLGYSLVVIAGAGDTPEPVSRIVRSLSAPFPVPILVVADGEAAATAGALGDTPFRVTLVQEPHRLEAGTIGVVGSSQRLSISGSAVQPLTDDGAPDTDGPGVMPPIDRALSGAADAAGEGLIAVLVGDGAAPFPLSGARQVRALGGTVIVQAPEDDSGAVLAIPPTVVDIRADLEAIGPLVNDLVTGAAVPPQAEEDRAFTVFLEHLRERTAIDFATYKRPTILRRLQRRMAATGTRDLREYIRFAQQHDEEFDRLASSFLIKVTEFFRDPDLYEYLRTDVLPDLIETARSSERELRIWSAGCATGEEAYSLAILIDEVMGEGASDLDVRIFATDLDNEAIAFARRGVYPASAMEAVSPQMLERYFVRVGNEYEVRKAVRSMIVFGQHDLGQRAPFPRIDLILCRNVLIYFTTELQKRALQLFAFSLRDDGCLVLGKAESTTPLPESFTLQHPRLKIYRRHGERVLIPPARIRDTLAMAQGRARRERPSSWPESASALPRERGRGNQADKAEAVLLRLPVGIVTADRNYDIQWINGSARMLLGIHGSAIGHDLIHLATSLPSSILRQAIDGAFRGTTGTSEQELGPSASSSGRRWVELVAHPHPGEDGESMPQLVVLLVRDVTASVLERRRLDGDLASERGKVEELTTQMAGLSETYTDLLGANQELATSNAELRSANEELLVANEEVQAATEEVETLNEELQATNEELETLNEELQATVEELNTTNDDLQARTVELDHSADELRAGRRSIEAARALLASTVDLLETPILVVDRDGSVALVNRSLERLLDDAPAIDHEPGSSGRDGTLQALASAAAGDTVTVTTRGTGRFQARTQPAVVGAEVVGRLVVLEPADGVPTD